MKHKIIAFDGLSLSGKSTMVQMLKDRSANAEVMRENYYDPLRGLTSKVNKLLKVNTEEEVLSLAAGEYPEHEDILKSAMDYGASYKGKGKKQAILAYLFTSGRSFVDTAIRELVDDHSLILDRYRLTGCAYQVEPEEYSWQDINALNESFGIIMPDIQFLLTCPIEQVSVRRKYRQKQGIGTAGQMSIGRENIILPAFLEIYEELKDNMPIYLIENAGVPVPELEKQISQAIPTYSRIESILKEQGWKFKEDSIGNPEEYWLQPDQLKKIYERQCVAKKIPKDARLL